MRYGNSEYAHFNIVCLLLNSSRNPTHWLPNLALTLNSSRTYVYINNQVYKSIHLTLEMVLLYTP